MGAVKSQFFQSYVLEAKILIFLPNYNFILRKCGSIAHRHQLRYCKGEIILCRSVDLRFRLFRRSGTWHRFELKIGAKRR
jgi:hypothetical protein